MKHFLPFPVASQNHQASGQPAIEQRENSRWEVMNVPKREGVVKAGYYYLMDLVLWGWRLGITKETALRDTGNSEGKSGIGWGRLEAQLRRMEQGPLSSLWWRKAFLGGKCRTDPAEVKFMGRWGEQVKAGHSNPSMFISRACLSLNCSSLLNLNLEHKGTTCSLGPSILPQESSGWLNALFHRENGLAGPPSPTHAEKIWSKAMNPRVSAGEICPFWASLVAQMVKNLPAIQETWVSSLVQEDSLEKGMATLSNILAWRISWTEEPGGL